MAKKIDDSLWFEFGDNVLVHGASITFAAREGCEIKLIVSGHVQIIGSSSESLSLERYTLIRTELGFK